MNWRMIQRNAWQPVHIEPTPRRFDGGKSGQELEPLEDLWLLYAPTKSGLTILNLRTHHIATLSKAQIRNYDDPDQRGKDYAALVLREQINLGGNYLWFTALEGDMGRRRHFMEKFVAYAAAKGRSIDSLIQLIDSGISTHDFCRQVFSS